MLTILAQSLEYVQVQVSAPGVNGPYDPTGDVVQFAFEPSSAAPSTWYTGSWFTPVANTYFAQCLVGPSGAVTLTPGTYTIWIKITDSPEIVVRTPGSLQVQ